MFTLDNLFLLLTGLLAAYLCWYFWKRYGLHNVYYLMGFAVLLVSGLLFNLFGAEDIVFALRVDRRQPDPAGHLDGPG